MFLHFSISELNFFIDCPFPSVMETYLSQCGELFQLCTRVAASHGRGLTLNQVLGVSSHPLKGICLSFGHCISQGSTGKTEPVGYIERFIADLCSCGSWLRKSEICGAEVRKAGPLKHEIETVIHRQNLFFRGASVFLLKPLN